MFQCMSPDTRTDEKAKLIVYAELQPANRIAGVAKKRQLCSNELGEKRTRKFATENLENFSWCALFVVPLWKIKCDINTGGGRVRGE